jgi:hypothetical protein
VQRARKIGRQRSGEKLDLFIPMRPGTLRMPCGVIGRSHF